MRPLRLAGVALIVVGGVVLALRGISYTKERESVQVGPLGVTAERRGFISPAIGLVVVAVGVVLLIAGGRRKA